MTGGRRALAAGRLAAWTAALVAALAGLHAVGGPLAPPPLGDPAQLGAWLDGRQPAEAAVAVVRLVALGLAWYLLAVTVAGTVARALGARALARAVDAVSVPAVRRLVHGAMGLSLTVAAVGGPAGMAAAHDAAAAPGGAAAETMTRLPDEAPPTMSPLDEAPPDVPEPAEPADRADAADPTRPAGPGTPPADAPGVAADAALAPTWAVQPGEHFWSVAERVLAGAWARPPADAEVDPYWRDLVEANRSLLRDPGNPDLLFPGQVLTVPPPPPAPPAP